MAYAGPVILTGDHALEGFDCGKPALDEWLRSRALANQSSGASRTWVVVEEGSSDVVAYYASTPEARREPAKAICGPLRRQLEPLISPTLWIMRSWRLARHRTGSEPASARAAARKAANREQGARGGPISTESIKKAPGVPGLKGPIRTLALG